MNSHVRRDDKAWSLKCLLSDTKWPRLPGILTTWDWFQWWLPPLETLLLHLHECMIEMGFPTKKLILVAWSKGYKRHWNHIGSSFWFRLTSIESLWRRKHNGELKIDPEHHKEVSREIGLCISHTSYISLACQEDGVDYRLVAWRVMQRGVSGENYEATGF